MVTTEITQDTVSANEPMTHDPYDYGPERYVAAAFLFGLAGLVAVMFLGPLFALWQ